jgi:hypothetical protein
MAVSIETVYLGHDNDIRLILKSDGSAVNLAAITDMTVSIGEVTVESDNGDSDPIRWAKAGYATGEVRLFLGAQSLISSGPGLAWLIVYDTDHPNGTVWGSFKYRVIPEVENT